MKRALIAIAVTLSLVFAAAAQEKPKARSKGSAPSVEASVRKLWEAYKNKDKAALAGMLDDGFRMFEEGTSKIGDKNAEVNAPDEFELTNYTLSDFTVKPIAPNAALVTYHAQYEGKAGTEASKGNSIFGEVWIHSGGAWKALYLQETYLK